VLTDTGNAEIIRSEKKKPAQCAGFFSVCKTEFRYAAFFISGGGGGVLGFRVRGRRLGAALGSSLGTIETSSTSKMRTEFGADISAGARSP